jgi:uncharacterized protein (TIGR03437 family)
MCRASLAFLLPVLAAAQTIATRLDPINLISPATNRDGSIVVFGAAMTPDAQPLQAANLFLSASGVLRQLTNLTGDVASGSVTSVTYASGQCAYALSVAAAANVEEVHLIEPASGGDRILVTDKQGCIQPLCIGCTRACVGPVHLTSDGGKVLYAVARQQPFYVVNADGSGLTQLAIYQGALAPSPRRVIGGSSIVVFTSSAPSGPTLAAAATDVYTINLDGTGLRQVTEFGNASFFAGNATISSDAAWIAFESNYAPEGPQAVTQIWLVRSDGSGLRKLSTGTGPASNPAISADGSVVTFLQSGQVMRVTGGAGAAPVALTAFSTSAPRDPALSDDGSTVIFTTGPPGGTSASVRRLPTAFAGTPLQPALYAPRFLNANGVASAAGAGTPTPGSLVTAYGANLGSSELDAAAGFPLPTSLNGLSLLVDGSAIPLTAVTPWQVNTQLPQTTPAGSVTLQVRDAGGVTLAPLKVAVSAFDPVNFAYPFVQKNLFYSQAAALHAGTGLPADMDHPLAAGETVEIYGLGLGVTMPMVDAGVQSPVPPARAVQTPRLQIGGRDAEIVFAGLTPGFVGLYQVNAIVPAGLSTGIQTVAWRGSSGTTSYSSVAVK